MVRRIRKDLQDLRADYAKVNGAPFQHFYCPMLLKDDLVELCEGHVLNEKLQHDTEWLLPQRKDIDGWYGSVVEADFLTLLRAKGKTVTDAFFTSEIRKQLKPTIVAAGQGIEYYHVKGKPIDDHTPLLLECGERGYLRLALKRPPQDVAALQTVKWNVGVFGDYRIAALASLLKAAYLTLFWKLGYKYGLSSPGLAVGYEILGKFYRENHDKSRGEVRAAALEFFRPCVNMARPAITGGSAPRGTIEDNRALVWLGSSGRGIAVGVFVRTQADLHCVLMPGFCDDGAAAVYCDFLSNPTEKIFLHEAEFVESAERWEVCGQRLEVPWPKKHESFDLTRSPEEILGFGKPSVP